MERYGNLWTVPIDGGAERPITDFSGRRGSLGSEALASDGEYLNFAWEETVGDNLVMDVVRVRAIDGYDGGDALNAPNARYRRSIAPPR